MVGILLLGAISLLSEKIYRKIVGQGRGIFPLVGLFIATEWHFIWAALSGMETLLYAFGIILTFYLLLFHPNKSLCYRNYHRYICLGKTGGNYITGPLCVRIFF